MLPRNMPATESQPAQVSADARRAISRSVVSLLKEHLGRGPVKAKTYIHEDSVLILMYEGHTVSEETLSDVGQAEAVASQRGQGLRGDPRSCDRRDRGGDAPKGDRLHEQQPARAVAALLCLRPRFDGPARRELTAVV